VTELMHPTGAQRAPGSTRLTKALHAARTALRWAPVHHLNALWSVVNPCSRRDQIKEGIA
jgi:hypothetical protein